jgi:hypothetical protein
MSNLPFLALFLALFWDIRNVMAGEELPNFTMLRTSHDAVPSYEI